MATQERIKPDISAQLLLDQLRVGFSGQVITPDDDLYDQARRIFYGGIANRPALIVLPTKDSEVAAVVSFARESGLELAIRSSGHSSAGHSATNGGILLDLSRLRALEIDPTARTAWAETGLTAGEVTLAASEYGLAVGFGDTGSVGIGGITLGGGIGYLVRKYGLTIDSLLAAEIVTADGEIRYTDSINHPDLFWAIRGGGGNFGVVTRLKFQLHEVSSVVGGMLILPATPEVIAGFMAQAEAAPEALAAIANIMPAPPMPFLPPELHGKIILMALMAYVGKTEAGLRAVTPFRALATPYADMLRPITYPELYPPEDDSYHPTAVSRTLFLNRVDLATAAKIVQTLQTSEAAFKVTQLRVLGGAMARVPAEATAFAHRQSKIMVSLAAFYEGEEDRHKQDAWVEQFQNDLRQEDSGVYVNFIGPEGGTYVQRAYPAATWARLREVKAKYDPTNLFRLNHNIPPAV